MVDRNYITMKYINANEYEVLTNSNSKKYTENQLRNYIDHLLEDNRYVVQEYPAKSNNLPEVHSLVMKNKDDKWQIINSHIQLTTVEANESIKLTEQALDEFIEDHSSLTNLNEQLETLTVGIAEFLEKKIDRRLSEIVMKSVVEDDKTIRLIEVDPNGAGNKFDEDFYTNILINYAVKLGALEKVK